MRISVMHLHWIRHAYYHASAREYEQRKAFARENRKNPTPAEEKLWQALKGKKLCGFKFRRQHIIGEYIVDFVCLQKHLIVEVDGSVHDQGEAPLLDAERTSRLEAKGFRLIRFRNEAVLTDVHEVLKVILQSLRELPDVG